MPLNLIGLIHTQLEKSNLQGYYTSDLSETFHGCFPFQFSLANSSFAAQLFSTKTPIFEPAGQIMPNIFGIYLRYLWGIFEISLGYLGDILGISLGYLWDIFGISLGYL